ncbi:MAG: phosphate/phosphite/phosphonate ABC transporter substrate-binding protein [Paraglaciecola sp.]|uniref:phosphate/phosphite/phosphonate ABC transporter substrate-binding protein n=1 Tax=Paraglaciecola sp. TaxID=1920173 RepID=UPI0032637508
MLKTLLLFSLLVSSPLVTIAHGETLTFGIVPQQSAKRLATLWTPILQRISETSGINVKFSTARDIPTFEQRLAEGAYDIAYMNPYHYVVFNKQSGYLAIAKQQGKTIKGVIVAKVGSNINTIEDLDGTRLAFPAPAAFAASILPIAELKRHGISFKPSYVSSHDSVYLNVSKGFFPAGGGIKRTLNNMSEGVKSQLVTIWETQGYTPHAIAVNPKVSDTSKQKILSALLELNNNIQGKELLKSINFKGIDTATNNDWDDVRSLNLETLMGTSLPK